MNEFEIIARYFKRAYPESQGDLRLGIGDDAAIIRPAANAELLVSMDTLVAGAHFFANAPAADIAHKAREPQRYGGDGRAAALARPVADPARL